MSYILEALKRAEKERKLGQAPTALDEIAIPQADTGQARRRWILIGAAAVLLVAAVIYGVLRYLHSDGSATAAASGAAIAAADASPALPAPIPQAVATPPVEPVSPLTEPQATAQAVTQAEGPDGNADPNAQHRIEGGEGINSLDDLTEVADAAKSDAEDRRLQETAGQVPDERVNRDAAQAAAPSKAAAALAEAARLAAQQSAKPTIIKPEIPPAPARAAAAVPAPKPTPTSPAAAASLKPPPVSTALDSRGKASTVTPQPAASPSATANEVVSPAPKGPRAPPAGPVVVMGEKLQIIEPPRPARPEPQPSAAPASTESATPALAARAEPEVAPTAADAAPVELPVPEKKAAASAGRRAKGRSDGTAVPEAPDSRVDVGAGTPASANRERTDRLDSLRRFKEMPPGFRAEFPPLTVDVHVYNADGIRSFVIVNGKRYRNGDTLSEGPRIAEIVPEGIVFEWRGEKVLYALGR